MRYIICLYISILIICGCSKIDNILSTNETIQPIAGEIQQRTDWVWDAGLYYVSETHTSIERLPYRMGNLHFNVTKLVEPPNCYNCLNIGKLTIQPDGTIKFNVTLRHPFPNTPMYTGFDVRGTIIFPATKYWKREPPWIFKVSGGTLFENFDPFYFSRAEDGGGQLLNADGFTFYFFPGFNVPGFDLPIFKYKKGKYAVGKDPDSTVNGYKVFTNDPDRRMFLVTDMITRTYHISPPDGEFTFGYVVDACWTPPTKTPVTDPKNDFPFWANCEDGYIIKSEQMNPFKLGTYGPPSWTHYPPCNCNYTSAVSG